MSNRDGDGAQDDSAIDREVVVSEGGKRYHRIPHRDTARKKDSACGGFVRSNLERIPQSEAEERGYLPCRNCDWMEVPYGR